MTIDEAIDRNTELKGELVREGRIEKADSVQLSIEALKRVEDSQEEGRNLDYKLLPGETKD